MQEKALQVYATTGNVEIAAKKAGYSNVRGAYAALAVAGARDEVLRIQQEKLVSEILPLAVDVHKRLLTDPGVPAAARVQAVKLAYDRTLGASGDGTAKSLDTMSEAELAAELDKIKRRRAELAQVVDAEIVEAPAGGVFD